ncbi:hypothetical protein [Wolbachia endosymbiont of Armadillidium arcangelii]|uniref:Phage related protein n=1 Tax=Wolbachia endosymbiont of Armadillidium arcangelii TaxID=3158571 RepID=A0AAU7Q2R3_9RICK
MITNREFWESSLEMPVSFLLKDFQNPSLRESWLDSLSGRQLSVIFNHYFQNKQNRQLFKDHEKCDDISTQQKRKMLIKISESLFDYYLVNRFSRAKSETTIAEVAQSVLGQDLLKSFLLQNNKYDKKSLLFTLFITNRNLLKQIFCFNQVQKKGFLPFVLKNPPRQKSTSFKNFLSESTIQEILKQHDLSENDSFESQFQELFYYQNSIYLFIRRASKDKDFVISLNKVIHGYKPDWIIFDFSSNANQVHLSTKNIKHGLKIANSIVSLYFALECSFVSLHSQNTVAQVRTFLCSCIPKSGLDDISICELKLTLAKPQTFITLNTNEVEKWLNILEPSVGSVLHEVSLIQYVKVIFKNKKVTLSFRVQDSSYIAINYSEHVLDKKEREDFKLLFRNTYGLTILSKAQYYCLSANNY